MIDGDPQSALALSARLRMYLHSTAHMVRAFRHDCVTLCPLHAHDTCEIILHLGGSGWEWVAGGQPRPFVAGGITFIPAGISHAQRMEHPGEDVCLHLPTPVHLPSELASPIMVAAGAELLLQQQILALARPAAAGELQQLMRDQMLRAVLSGMLALARTPAGEDGYVARAQRMIAERFRELQSLSEVATALRLSPDHLRHLFKHATGRSLIDHLTMVRMSHARQLLEHTSLPIAAIASQCGYASHRRFGAIFRQTYATTATAYRQRHAH